MFIDNEPAYEYIHNCNYYITKSGKIYSTYVVGGRGRTDKSNPHLLAYGTDRYGYYRVVLSLYGKKRYIHIHTAVVEQFFGNIPNGMVVNHKDGDKHNNSISNLEITTPKENTLHAHKYGLTSSEISVDVKYENNDYHFNSITECIKYFPDISREYIRRIRSKLVLFSMVKFEREGCGRICPIIAYYNGAFYKRFNTMQEADEHFGMKHGATSSALKYNEYRNRVNKYIITFPNVSTIESTEHSVSE